MEEEVVNMLKAMGMGEFRGDVDEPRCIECGRDGIRHDAFLQSF